MTGVERSAKNDVRVCKRNSPLPTKEAQEWTEKGSVLELLSWESVCYLEVKIASFINNA